MTHRNGQPVMIAVAGPTASGKTALAMALAEEFRGEILNTDSLQVYRYFDIGTAKPSVAEQRRVRHHLIDVIDPDQTYSAARYVRDARSVITDLGGRGRLPVLCGGTGLYFRALLQGMADIPEIPGDVHARVQKEVSEKGLAACHADLAAVDPETAARVHPNDPIRVVRALEVYHATGRTLSQHHREQPFSGRTRGVLSVGYQWPRAALYERINRRVREMLEQGWRAEVERILARGYGCELKPFRSIGYQEVLEAVQGRRPEETLAEDIARRTRHYAKRQLTWFRKHPDIFWAEPGEEAKIRERVRFFLKTGR